MSLFEQTNDRATITAFYALTLTHFDMSLHQHESCEIMYVKRGRCVIETTFETRTLYEGEFIFLDSFTPHRLVVDAKTSCSLLNLEFLVAPTGTISLHELRATCLSLKTTKLPHHLLFAYDSRKLKQPLEHLITCLTKSPLQTHTPEDFFLMSLLFQQVLVELVALLDSRKQLSGSPYLDKALAFIHDHLQDEIRVPTIAQHVGINKSYLHLLFSQHLDETISNYVNRKRLEQARFLLANSELSVTDIAFQVGYNSRQHFSNTFSRYYDVSPQHYQLKQQHVEHSPKNTGQYRKEADNWHIINMKQE